MSILIRQIMQQKLIYKENGTGIDISKLSAGSGLISLKAEVDKIDVVKLKTVPVDLSKLNKVLNNDVVDLLSRFVLKSMTKTNQI